MNAFTLREVAKAFDVRPNAVTDWKKDGCPLDAALYDLDAVETWCKANRKGKDTIAISSRTVITVDRAMIVFSTRRCLERESQSCRRSTTTT
jgi:hypothetical protein